MTRATISVRTSEITHGRSWATVALVTLAATLPSGAADDAALLKNLTSVIALLGLPCGSVVSAARLGDKDHVATCRDGNRYRVFINPEGRWWHRSSSRAGLAQARDA